MAKFPIMIARELKLIQREIVDGCNECIGKYNMCQNHQAIFSEIVASPAKYIRLKHIADGKMVCERLINIETIEGGGRAVGVII